MPMKHRPIKMPTSVRKSDSSSTKLKEILMMAETNEMHRMQEVVAPDAEVVAPDAVGSDWTKSDAIRARRYLTENTRICAST